MRLKDFLLQKLENLLDDLLLFGLLNPVIDQEASQGLHPHIEMKHPSY